MNPPRHAIRTLHVAALGICLGTLASVGIAAAIAFPMMKSLHPSLPDYAAYSGEHWRIAAGSIMDRVFHAAEIVQIACLLLAAITLASEIAERGFRTRRMLIVRSALVIAAFGVLGAKLAILNPRMDRELTAFRDAAKAADANAAEQHQAAFDRDHPRASAALYASTLLVGALLVAAALDRPALPRRVEDESP